MPGWGDRHGNRHLEHPATGTLLEGCIGADYELRQGRQGEVREGFLEQVAMD